MAENRRLTDLIYGHVGKLTYTPQDGEGQQVGVLHTGRNTVDAPYFQVIGASAELYPASKSKIPEGSSHLWQERRTQRRWLLRSHPEAFMGNSALQELLEENTNRFHKIEGEATDRPLLSIGQMTNVCDPSRVSGMPVLAVATGESGELLRLARVHESDWQWEEDRHVGLKLSVIDPDDQEEEVIWASDGLPISQIKFATSLSRYDPVRWLLIQKQTSTTILQPEYHKVPVAKKHSADVSIQQRLSRIDPNPALAISHKQTGGNAHTDVAINPGSKGLSPQIAVIDECGYWTVWSILGSSRGGKSNLRLSMLNCGHIMEGLLEHVPPIPAFPAERHGILFVGTAKPDPSWEDSSQAGQSGASLKRSQYLLLWNNERFEVFDLALNVFLPKPASFAITKAKSDWILDIQVNPFNQNHIFVLTKRYLYWIDLFAPGLTEELPLKSSILLTCPNSMDMEGTKMTVSRVLEGSLETAMVVIYSPQTKQLHSHWFDLSADTQFPQWHRRVFHLPHKSNSPVSLQTFDIRPVAFVHLGGLPSGLGSHYHKNGVRFYQGTILGQDLSVRYCVCASYQDRDLEVELPSTRIGQSKADQAQRWRRKRKNFLRHMGASFVLPDGISDADLDAVMQPNAEVQRPLSPEGNSPSRSRGAMLNLGGMAKLVQGDLLRGAQVSGGISSTLISAAQEGIDKGVVDGKLPLTTWHEIARAVDPSAETGSVNNAGQFDLLNLLERTDDETVVAFLGRDTQDQSGPLLSLPQLNAHFSRLWLEPLEGKLSEECLQTRRQWLAEIANDAFLSSHGVMVQDTRLLGARTSESVQASQAHYPGSVTIKSSQSSAAPSIASSPPTSATTNAPDLAVQRLQLLAPSLRLDKMSAAKQSTVLSYWPTEAGVGTHDYVSSVAIASDRKFDDARQRLQRIEARRKAQAEKYKIPALKRQGFPAASSPIRGSSHRGMEELPTQPRPVPMHAMSSQYIPNSSQSQSFMGPSVAMSQPVPGAFGDRKKAKKSKKKSGFR